jgi:hypothetical protein
MIEARTRRHQPEGSQQARVLLLISNCATMAAGGSFLSDHRRHNRPRGGSHWPGRWSNDRPGTRHGGREPFRPREGHRREGGSTSSAGSPGRPGVGRPLNRAPGAAAQSAPLTDQIKSIDPFELFCAYHLGITKDKQYRPLNLHDVARRFNVDGSVIKQALQAYGMDADTLLNTEFDLTMAQLDIQVAPEGVDRVELAKGIYEEFRLAPRKQRDWKHVLEEDARENAKIFGRR